MGIKYLNPVKEKASNPLVEEVYIQIKRDFGKIVEPFSIHSSLPKLLAGVWMASRESELVGVVPRSYKEAVATTVSVLNNCSYCVDAHSIMLYATGKKGIADAICNGKYDQISDEKIRKIVKWTVSTLSPGSKTNYELPFSKEFEPEIIGTIIFYEYINRIANIFLSETPLPSNISWLTGIMKIVAGRMFSRAVKRSKSLGDSLKFLPKADLPMEFSWAKGSSNVSGAFARFASIVEKIGNKLIDSEVRYCIKEYLDSWTGEKPGVSRKWIELPTKKLIRSKRIAAQLALLTAIAPYQIDKKLVLGFKRFFPEDIKLLGLASWASFSAAKKIGTFLYSI